MHLAFMQDTRPCHGNTQWTTEICFYLAQHHFTIPLLSLHTRWEQRAEVAAQKVTLPNNFRSQIRLTITPTRSTDCWSLHCLSATFYDVSRLKWVLCISLSWGMQHPIYQVNRTRLGYNTNRNSEKNSSITTIGVIYNTRQVLEEE